ncbi:hypothetical protein BCA37_05000 [Mycobacterium sp. djl-10]|nr:hypothetical protein BCA37_05000 [Mycobacterium sp. djl-10]
MDGMRIAGPTLVALLLLTGCGSTTQGTPEADHSCAPAAGPMTTIDPVAEGEPQLEIPQPPGWNTSDALESPMIRFAMVNTDLISGNFAPNAVVTFENAGSESGEDDAVFTQQRELLETQLGATDVSTESGSRCGYPAQIISYTAPAAGEIPERSAKVLCVLSEVDGTTYLSTVTLSSVAPEEATYAADSEAILSGFRVTATP